MGGWVGASRPPPRIPPGSRASSPGDGGNPNVFGKQFPVGGPRGRRFPRIFLQSLWNSPPGGRSGVRGVGGGGGREVPPLAFKIPGKLSSPGAWMGWVGGRVGGGSAIYIYIYSTMFDTRSLSLLAKLVLQSEHHIQIMWACIMANRLSALRDIHTSGVISEAGNTINLGLTSLITIL